MSGRSRTCSIVSTIPMVNLERLGFKVKAPAGEDLYDVSPSTRGVVTVSKQVKDGETHCWRVEIVVKKEHRTLTNTASFIPEERVTCIKWMSGEDESEVLLLGFSSGYVRILDDLAKVIFIQRIHEAPVLKIRYREAGYMGSAVIFVFETSVIVVLSKQIRLCLSTYVEEHSQENNYSLWKFRKMMFAGVQTINDMATCPPASFPHTELSDYNLDPFSPGAHITACNFYFLLAGNNPMLSYVEVDENSVYFSVDNAKKLAGRFIQNGYSLIKSLWRAEEKDPHSERIEHEAKVREQSPSKYQPKTSLRDEGRIIHTIEISPCGGFAAAVDSKGRVLVIDCSRFSVKRMLKGRRRAQVGWLECKFPSDATYPRNRRHIFLVILIRGLLEVWRMGTNKRFAALNIGQNCHLIYSLDTSRLPTTSKVMIVRRDGVVQILNISNAYQDNPLIFSDLKSYQPNAVDRLRGLIRNFSRNAKTIEELFMNMPTSLSKNLALFDLLFARDFADLDSFEGQRRICQFCKLARSCCNRAITNFKTKGPVPDILKYYSKYISAYIIKLESHLAREPGRKKVDKKQDQSLKTEHEKGNYSNKNEHFMKPLKEPPKQEQKDDSKPPSLTISLALFIKHFLPEEKGLQRPRAQLLRPATFIFEQIISEEKDAGLPVKLLQTMELSPRFVSELFLAWISGLHENVKGLNEYVWKFAKPVEITNWIKRSRVKTSKGLDWTDDIFSSSLQQEPIWLERRLMPTIEYLISNGHFSEGAALFCKETTELVVAFLLARVCDKGCIHDSNAWFVLQTRILKLHLLAVFFECPSISASSVCTSTPISFLAARHVLQVINTDSFKDFFVDNVTFILEEMKNEQPDPKPLAHISEKLQACLRNISLGRQIFPGHITPSRVAFYLLLDSYRKIEDSETSAAISKENLILVEPFITLAEQLKPHMRTAALLGLALRLWSKCLLPVVNNLLDDHGVEGKHEINKEDAERINKTCGKLFKFLQTISKPEDQLEPTESKELEIDDDLAELSSWPPIDSSHQEMDEYTDEGRAALRFDGGMGLERQLQAFVLLLRLVFVCLQEDLPLPFKIKPVGEEWDEDDEDQDDEELENIGLKELFVGFSRLHPLATAEAWFREPKHAPLVMRIRVLLQVAYKNIHLALKMTKDWKVDEDEMRGRIIKALYEDFKDHKVGRTKLMHLIENKQTLVSDLVHIAKKRLAWATQKYMQDGHTPHVFAKIPANLFQNLSERQLSRSFKKRADNSKRPVMPMTMVLLTKVSALQKENPSNWSVYKIQETETLVRLTRILCL